MWPDQEVQLHFRQGERKITFVKTVEYENSITKMIPQIEHSKSHLIFLGINVSSGSFVVYH